jgi:DNA-binding protein YbaB
MANSPLRQILVDMFVSHAFVIDEEIEHHFPHEMLLDMINSAARSTQKKTAKLSKSKMAKYLISVDDVRRR